MAETQIVAAREEHRYYPYSGIFFVTRRSFWAAGQDSFSSPPTQNPDMFTALTNVEPVTQGVLKTRRGYGLFSSQVPTVPYTLGYSFRNDLLGLRDVVFTSPSNVLVTDELGNAVINPLFVPSAGATTPRMVLSRNFGYFTDGVPADNQKWDGTGLSKWGIDINSAQASVGPNSPSSGSTTGTNVQRPTSFANDFLLSFNPYSNPTLAFDGNPTTFASGIDNNVLTSPSGCLWKGFAAGPPSPNSITLSITSGVTKSGGVSNVTGSLSYSLDGGATFKNIYSVNGSRAVKTDIVVLPLSQDLTKVQVLAEAIFNGGTGQVESDIYEISISVNGALWTNPGNIFSLNGIVATATTPAATTAVSGELLAQGFSFSGLSSANIKGILVEAYVNQVVYTGNENCRVTLFSQLLKAGVPTGSTLTSSTLGPGAVNAYVPMGGPSNLWGTTWLGSDVQAGGFGAQLAFSALQIGRPPGNVTQGTVTVSVDHVRITVFTQASPLIEATGAAGNITLLSGRVYFYAFQNSKTGHTSDISPASLTSGPVNSVQLNLSAIPTSTDPQVDTVLILATADGGDQTTLYQVTTLPIGTTTYVDNTPDALTAAVSSGPALLTNQLYQYTDAFGNLHGIANNAPPAVLNFPTKHKGRIYGSSGSTLFFSKNLDDITTANGLITAKWEEAWPAFYSLDISETAETIKGILSDGETLWIGTERAIRRLIGDSPSNFQKPEVQFNETGLFNQDVWKIVFYEGQPVGTMWLTPDLRVIASDFNTYTDVGRDIQDVLNTVNRAATTGPHASFVSKGPSDYFMLYLPTGTNTAPDTVAVYNLRTQKWFVWRPTDLLTASLFFIDVGGQPRWLVAAQAGNIYEWQEGSNQDQIAVTPTSYPITIKTSWLDFGDSNLRKALNQFLYLGAGQPQLQVEGAITDQDLDSTPQLLLPPTSVSTGPLRDLFVPLAGTPSQHRWYRFTFTATSSQAADVLDGFSVETSSLFRY